MTESELLTVVEVADELRCSRQAVRSMIGRGELRASKVAGRWLIPGRELRDLLAATEVGRPMVPPLEIDGDSFV